MYTCKVLELEPITIMGTKHCREKTPNTKNILILYRNYILIHFTYSPNADITLQDLVFNNEM